MIGGDRLNIMGICCSKSQKEENKTGETQVYPMPVITPTETHTSTIFDPEFTTKQKKKGKQESVPLLEVQDAPKSPDPKNHEDSSDSSSSIDQNMISKLLAEVDTSDLSN